MSWWEKHTRQREQRLQRLRDWEAFGLFKEEHVIWSGWRMGRVLSGGAEVRDKAGERKCGLFEAGLETQGK